MSEFSPAQLLIQLRELDECPRIEAKRGSSIGSSIMQTICAFANEPGLGGGYLLLGIAEPNEQCATFNICGVENTDNLLNNLQINCRDQFERAIPIKAEAVILEGKRVIQVFVPELDPAAKPCVFKGKFDSKNKRKTGVWRRGLNGDYECNQQELEPLLLAKAGLRFEQLVLPSAEWDDLDDEVIALYRILRGRVRPNAEELQVCDEEMLRALNLVTLREGQWQPNVAGLLLFGKPLALRRLLPAVRVDYVRVAGTRWVDDPHQRFETTLDIREPLIRLIPKLEHAILDDLPRHFRLEDGATQRSDVPLLPYKVVREAVVNAVMHRDYSIHQPTLIVRYSNRIEIRNAGYSLKPSDQLGETGSVLRNPILAAVLYDLNFAETKGTGIRTMRRLLHEAGLEPPVFSSHVLHNQFISTYLLHQLLGEEQLAWLKQFTGARLSNDEAKALILAKETGAVDNAALRDITGLGTLEASYVLRKLTKQKNLLIQGGTGVTTYYQLAPDVQSTPTDRTNPTANTGDLTSYTGHLASYTGDLASYTGDLAPHTGDLNFLIDNLPTQLAEKIHQLTPRPRKENLWPIIVWLCALHPLKAEHIAKILGGRQITSLKANHINPLRIQKGFIEHTQPEVLNHPEQAYKTTAKGIAWLQTQGIQIND